jgi:hypothetical protein
MDLYRALLCKKIQKMRRMVGCLVLMLVFGGKISANKDSLMCIELSGKVTQKGAEQCKAYRVELRSGEELIRSIYSGNEERFTLFLKRNMQYSMKPIANGSESEQVFINKHLSVNENGKEHGFNRDIEFSDNECKRSEEVRRTGGL